MNSLRALTSVLVIGLMGLAGHTAVQAGGQYTTIDYPGAVCQAPGDGTVIYGIGLTGDVVGQYTRPSQVAHGFLLHGGVFTTIDPPGAVNTLPTGIAANGEIEGAFLLDAQGPPHGFLLYSGRYTTFDVPVPAGDTYYGTVPFGVDPQGDIVGQYFDSIGSQEHAFLRKANGTYSTFDYPGSVGTVATGITAAGEIAGFYYDVSGIAHGFQRQPNGSFTAFDVPGAASGTYANAINLQGDVTGGWIKSPTPFVVHGFLRTPNGTLTTFDDPSYVYSAAAATAGLDQGTSPHGINPQGIIAGKYSDAQGCFHGFLRMPG